MGKQDKNYGRERAVLVGLHLRRAKRERKWDVSESLAELESLAKTAGAAVVDQVIVERNSPHPATFVGKGKALELKTLCDAEAIGLLLFDDDLSPAQFRNLTELTGKRVVDRSQLILDIFARRSSSRESKLEIELVQLQYLLPRLMGMWQHLSRQEGGVGTRGPGEKQLEVDRRRVRERISRLKRELKRVTGFREVQRQRRRRRSVPVVSIIGYTNAGKSTLFNTLTEGRNLVEDKLFATLDPTVRRWRFSGDFPLLISDTVGFIRKLPHHLIESFKGTMEEATHSELILNVVDVSDPMAREKNEVVYRVLKDLGVERKPMVTVLNKTDLVEDALCYVERYRREGNLPVIPISAKTGDGVNRLCEAIGFLLSEDRVVASLRIPQEKGDLISLIYREGHVYSRRFRSGKVYLKARIPLSLVSRVADYGEILRA